MTQQPKRLTRKGLLSRYLLVERSEVSLSTNPSMRLFGPHSAYITFIGHLDEPLKGVTEARVQVNVNDSDEANPETVGAIIAMKPHIQCSISTTAGQFDLMWSLALSNRCRTVHLAFDTPSRGRALVRSWSASTELPDQE